jgi:hypothetical protein
VLNSKEALREEDRKRVIAYLTEAYIYNTGAVVFRHAVEARVC